MSTKFAPNGLSRSARTGLITLLVIIAGLFILWRLLPILNQQKIAVEDAALTAAWNQFKEKNTPFQKENLNPQETVLKNHSPSIHNSTKEISLFYFDPNSASEDEFILLGLTPAVAKTIVRFRNKGGQFRKPEDFQKIYTLSAAQYQRLAPYIKIPSALETIPSSKNENQKQTSKPVEPEVVFLNSATVEELMQLKGIGPVYAGRIVKFRDKLGGFYETAQLKEVYGFPDSTFQLLQERFVTDATIVRKLNVNTATVTLLAHHPYISKKMAENIVQVRNDRLHYQEMEELLKVPLINAENYRKIVPYLKLSD